MFPSEDNVSRGLIIGDLEAFVREMIPHQFHIAVDSNQSIERVQLNHGIIVRRWKTFTLSSRLK